MEVHPKLFEGPIRRLRVDVLQELQPGDLHEVARLRMPARAVSHLPGELQQVRFECSIEFALSIAVAGPKRSRQAIVVRELVTCRVHIADSTHAR